MKAQAMPIGCLTVLHGCSWVQEVRLNGYQAAQIFITPNFFFTTTSFQKGWFLILFTLKMFFMYINRLTVVASVAFLSMLSCKKELSTSAVPLAQDGSVIALANVRQANGGSSVIHDPTGDSDSPAPYMDVVHAKITEQQSGTLFFMMVLAGPIPEQPSAPDLIWVFHLDTNPATAPGGLYNEYIVRVRWISGAFVGQVIDRTPLLTGGAPIITAVPFSIHGRTVKMFAQLEVLGNPSTFGWNAATRPGVAANYVDFAPDSGLVTWIW